MEDASFSQLIKNKRNASPMGGPRTKRKEVKEAIPLRNRFEVLSDNEDGVISAGKKENITGNVTAKKTTPPPILIHGNAVSHKGFTEKIKRHIKEKFYIKYSSSRISTYTSCVKDYTELLSNIDESTQYHTYTMKQEKTRAFVIRGLTSDIEHTEIQNEMIEKGLLGAKCIQMRGIYSPLFMVTTTSSINEKELNQKIKFLNYTRVRWERYFNKKKITQCHRCQEWEHATANWHPNVSSAQKST